MDRPHDIRRDLARTIVKEPLLSMVRDTANSERHLPVILEINPAHFHALTRRIEARPLDSARRYMRASLLPREILSLIDGLTGPLPIARIWYDHPIQSLIDKSVST